jgi:hypothetical protein
LADRIVIDGLRPWDGSYELDIDEEPLTTTEWGWIKRRAGYLPLTLDANAFADPELIAVLAAIAVRRGGTVETRDMDDLLDRIFDAPFGPTVTLHAGDQAGDAGPPPASSAPKQSSNGDSSTTASDSSASPAAATGDPASDTSESGLATAVN